MQKKYHVKKGDKVQVISGKWKGDTAKVVTVLCKKDRVVLELENLSPEKKRQIGQKTVRRTADSPGGLVERSVSVHVSNVKVVEAAKTA